MALDYFFSNKKKKSETSAGRTPQIISAAKEKPHRKEWVIDYKRLTYIVIFFAIVLFGWWLALSPTFEVTEIVYEEEPSPTVKNKINSLEGRNILFLNLSSLAAEWQEEEPIIKTIKIYRGIPHTLRVSVEERDRAIVWKSNDKYYLLDSTGIAYKNIGSDLGENHLAIIDDNNVKFKLGERIVSRDFVEAVQQLIDELPSKIGDENIKEMHVGESSFNIEVQTDKDIKIKFDIIQPLDLQMEAVEKIYAENRNDVKKYIDVRVIGKAYIK